MLGALRDKVRNLMGTVENPLISIVMLCYNHEKFVAEALDGVLAQTYSPLEIVIVDDCSQDSTAEIVSTKLSEAPARSDIRFLRNSQNRRLLGACEVGINASKGSFIVLTCDDDVMLPGMVTEMVKQWRHENISLVATNAEIIDEHSQSRGQTVCDCNLPADDSFETLARDGANACCFGASIGFEREIYSVFGLPPAHLDNLDIMLPFYAYLLKGARFINKPLLKYRIHGKNNSLSLIAERSNDLGRLMTREHIYYGHIAHAVAMQEELNRLSVTMPVRYAELAPRIGPLLTIQTVEMAKNLVRTKIELQELRGI
jgi:glycosyltransferase involved in cell wall biosynthesis